MKKPAAGLIFIIVLTIVLGVLPAMALTIGGAVKQPLNLSTADLARFESATARLNEVTGDGQFRGAFTYRGVPLRTLLGLASIQKEKSSFSKPFDLAVIVRNKDGKRAVLSWGEIFYRNPAEFIVAVSAEPVMPHHKNCAGCEWEGTYDTAMKQLKRHVGLPKLIVAGDSFTDRSLEDIVAIDVVDLEKKADKKRMKALFSPKFVVVDGKGLSVEVHALSGYNRAEVPAKPVLEGIGYQGWKQYSGVSLRDLLKNVNMRHEVADTIILASSVDGYRILISYGELFLARAGERILVVDQANGAPLKEGVFTLIFPDDIFADRTAKALSKIEVISLKKE